jgi:hypothetical protein
MRAFSLGDVKVSPRRHEGHEEVLRAPMARLSFSFVSS